MGLAKAEQLARPQVGHEANEHKHGEADEHDEGEALCQQTRATETNRVNGERTGPLRPPAHRARGAREPVLPISVLIRAPVQVAVQTVPGFSWRLGIEKKVSEIPRHRDINKRKRSQREPAPLAPNLEDDDRCQVHAGGAVGDGERP